MKEKIGSLCRARLCMPDKSFRETGPQVGLGHTPRSPTAPRASPRPWRCSCSQWKSHDTPSLGLCPVSSIRTRYLSFWVSCYFTDAPVLFYSTIVSGWSVLAKIDIITREIWHNSRSLETGILNINVMGFFRREWQTWKNNSSFSWLIAYF